MNGNGKLLLLCATINNISWMRTVGTVPWDKQKKSKRKKNNNLIIIIRKTCDDDTTSQRPSHHISSEAYFKTSTTIIPTVALTHIYVVSAAPRIQYSVWHLSRWAQYFFRSVWNCFSSLFCLFFFFFLLLFLSFCRLCSVCILVTFVCENRKSTNNNKFHCVITINFTWEKRVEKRSSVEEHREFTHYIHTNQNLSSSASTATGCSMASAGLALLLLIFYSGE